jgi:hypothetical protein
MQQYFVLEYPQRHNCQVHATFPRDKEIANCCEIFVLVQALEK